MRQAGGGENRNLLATSDGVHDVNGRNSSLDHRLGVIAGRGVDRLAVNVEVRLRENLGSIINDLSWNFGCVDGRAVRVAGDQVKRRCKCIACKK